MKYKQSRTTIAKLLTIIAVILFLTSCRKEHSYENPANSVVLATGSLWDASGNCLPASLAGTWYNGVTPGDTNYVDITVNVSKIGHYSIYTDLQNGVYLADSGAFTSLGETTVRLRPVGTFLNHTSTTFTVAFDTTACSFAIDVQDSTGTGLGGGSNGGGGGGTAAANSWQFTAGGHTYSGTASATVSSSQLGNILLISGTVPTFDSSLIMSLQIPAATPAAGTFKTTSTYNTIIFADASGNAILAADASVPSKIVTIRITSYDAATKTIIGTFDGTARAGSALTAPALTITNGSFNAVVN